MKKRRWIIIVVAVVVVALAVGGYMFFTARRAQAQAPVQTVTVRRGTVAVTVAGTGNLSPQSEVSVAPLTSGRVAEVLVEEGVTVTAGQPLLKLDSSDLQLQLEQAQASLALAQANEAKSLAAANPDDVAVARSAVSQAQANLNEQQVTLADSTEQARLSWIQSANDLRDAQAKYSEIYWSNLNLQQRLAASGQTLPQSDIDAEAAAWHAVQNAEAAMQQAQLAYEQAQQKQASGLSTAQSQLSSTQASLAKLTSGASAADIAVAQAQVQQAQLAVQQAQAQLDKATVTAPIAGTVTAVNVQVGDSVSTGQAVMVVSDLTHIEVNVNLDETDVASVTVGQKVQVQVDAFPNLRLSGQVTHIATTAQTQAGVVLYPVTITLDKVATGVRPGMTAEATILVASHDNVLLIPLRAISSTNGHSFVRRLAANGQVERVEVTLGLTNDTQVEVTSGLSEGDKVVVGTTTSTTTRTSSGFGLPGFFGGR